MMDIAQHIRIFDKTPSDELVEKRTESINALSEKYSKLANVTDILNLAADLTRAVAKSSAFPDSRATEVEAVIREKSSSFVREGQELQIVTCALLAALKLLTEAKPSVALWSRTDVLALGLWSGLGFQKPRTEERIESLRSELLTASREIALRSAVSARTRQDVGEVSIKTPEAYDQAKVASAVQNGMAKTIESLRTNAALDREEIDLLWWVLSGWSEFAVKHYSDMSEVAALISAAFEAGSLVRRLPGDAHKHLVLRLLKTDRAISLHEVLEELKGEREKLAMFFQSSNLLQGRDTVFPLIAACVAGKASARDGSRTQQLSDWAARALLESSILHVGSLPKNLV
jgi:hypothetical protein